MNRFFDTSAYVTLLRNEASTRVINELEDTALAIYGAQTLFAESITAIHRWMREGSLQNAELVVLRDRLKLNLERCRVQPIDDRVNDAVTVLTERHALRAADAIQLASWSVLQDALRERINFVCLDFRLRDAVLREGGAVEPATIP